MSHPTDSQPARFPWLNPDYDPPGPNNPPREPKPEQRVRL